MESIISYEAPTSDRIRNHTPDRLNRRIDAKARFSATTAVRSGEIRILDRLQKLDREWDVDRATLLTFAILGATAFLLGRKVNPRFHLLLGVQFSFLAYHAWVGWCPPMAVMRRLGIRSQKEIDAERFSLLQELRGIPV